MSADDLELLRKAEQALGEIDRTQGLDDHHADVLAALRIRIEGGPRKSLNELLDAAGTIEGKRSKELDDHLRSGEEKSTDDLGDMLRSEPEKRGKSLDDLLG